MTATIHSVTRPVSEKSWMRTVTDAAKLLGWVCFHTYDSRRSEPGFPDLTLVKGDRLIFAELKTERGKLSPVQHLWLDMLGQTRAECYVWKPSQWDEVERVLKGEDQP